MGFRDEWSSRSGSQNVVVETHSEHLFTRLRADVVADEADLANRVCVAFVERTEAGTACIRPARIEPFGKVQGWPSGFFMQAADEAALLLQRILKRRGQGKPKK